MSTGTESGYSEVFEAERKRCRRRIRVISVLATLGTLFFVVMLTIALFSSSDGENPFTGQETSGFGGVLLSLLTIVVMGWLIYYSVWSFLWGLVTIWPWWMRFPDRLGLVILTTPFGWLMIVFSFLMFGLLISQTYGFFGGAIYQYIKARKTVNAERDLKTALA